MLHTLKSTRFAGLVRRPHLFRLLTSTIAWLGKCNMTTTTINIGFNSKETARLESTSVTNCSHCYILFLACSVAFHLSTLTRPNHTCISHAYHLFLSINLLLCVLFFKWIKCLSSLLTKKVAYAQLRRRAECLRRHHWQAAEELRLRAQRTNRDQRERSTLRNSTKNV